MILGIVALFSASLAGSGGQIVLSLLALDALAVAGWGWFNSTYSFFGRADTWIASEATRPADLAQKGLDATHLVMSDQLSQWHVDNSWSYSHGQRPGINTDVSPPKFSGLNQHFGYGRVVWKSF